MSKYIANAFQIPNAVVDDFMAVISPNAFKCYVLIVRKTTGWGKSSDKISISQFMHYTGIKKRDTAIACLAELESLRLISPVKKSGKVNEYRLNMLPETHPENGDGSNGKPVLKNGTPRKTAPVPKNGTTPVPKNGTGTSPENGDTQNPLTKPTRQNIVVGVDAGSLKTADGAAEQTPEPAADIADESALVGADAPTRKPKSGLAEDKKRFEAVAQVFNRVFADCDAVVKVSLATVPDPKTGRPQYTQTNLKRLKLMPYAWSVARERVQTWQDENGLIDGEAPGSRHVLQWFETYFRRCLADGFVNGSQPRSAEHANWRAGFDYLLRPTEMEQRIFEGR